MVATSGWTILGAIGAMVGGFGAAIGGVAAWRAASASRETSRDALEALGLAIAPSLAGDAGIQPIQDGSETGRWHARIFNVGGRTPHRSFTLKPPFRTG